MAKLTDNFVLTSFHGVTIHTSYNKLVEAIGKPQCEDNSGEDKVNFDWDCETEDGIFFTIYDWKEYRSLDLDEIIEFHIGGKSQYDCVLAKDELQKQIK